MVSKPSGRANTAAKQKKRRKRKGEKKNPNIEKSKDIGHFLHQKLSENFDFCACPSHHALKRDAGSKKDSCCVANTFSTRVKLN